MERNVLATARFSAVSGDKQYTIVLELVPSGCFAYGNEHAVIYEVYDGDTLVSDSCFDARYDHRFDSEETFNINALDFVKDQVRDHFTVEKMA